MSTKYYLVRKANGVAFGKLRRYQSNDVSNKLKSVCDEISVGIYIGDIVKNEIGQFLKVEERFIDIRYENKTVIIQYKGTHCTEKGKAYKRVKTATRTDYFDLTK